MLVYTDMLSCMSFLQIASRLTILQQWIVEASALLIGGKAVRISHEAWCFFYIAATLLQRLLINFPVNLGRECATIHSISTKR